MIESENSPTNVIPCNTLERIPSPKQLQRVFPKFAFSRRVVHGESNNMEENYIWFGSTSCGKKHFLCTYNDHMPKVTALNIRRIECRAIVILLCIFICDYNLKIR